MYDPLGLSIGTTNLVAARNGSTPVTRRSVLTLYPHCSPKVGVHEADPPLNEAGMLIGGFVERIGDSVALVSADGSAHDPDLLMVEALDAMVVAAGADAAAAEIAIAVPAYWKTATVQALRNALRTHLGFVRSGMAPRLVSDAVAALTGANADLCLAATGVVGVIDFGGSGTSATLLNLAGDHELVTPTMRYAALSGDEIDQALLLRVFEELGPGSGIDPATTAAVGQLGRLRDQCRVVKERLSTEAAVEFAAELGGRSCTMRLSRDELGDLIQDRLTGFIFAFDEMLVRHRKSWADLSAVVTVGGGASIPLFTERLSVHGRRPVVTPPHPASAAAAGALLLASRGEELDLRTRTSIGLLSTAAAAGDVVDLGAGDVLVIDDEAMTDRELAWSQTEDGGAVRVRYSPEIFHEDGPSGWTMRLNLAEPPKARSWHRLRLSQLVIGMCAVVAMTSIGGVAYTLTNIENRHVPPARSVVPVPIPPVSSLIPRPTPPPPAPVPPSPEPVPSAAPPVVTTRRPPPTTATTTPPPPTTTTPTTTTTTTPPPPPTTPTTPTTTVPMTTEWIHVPLLPVPIPVPVPASPAPQAPAPQYPGGGYPQNPFLGPGY
ncbi:hypothetical protein AWB93_16115 [Mycobacterium bohemicum]|uniref:Molecular chaperone n=3 Tax=Mycobacterium bohemicum TaxID=56425 RepID=A0A1X1R1C2_MYCBE|nr:Hsp70 family protein [Mycobacterium bohemicum]ORU97917.1 hypothetical protein AWB93_15720 [Mycobacterium bohemicum]ORU97989.1 hypothetical protein AWB93_16115 [Mycobacterium bohemicum]